MLIGHPLDLVKVQMQTTSTSSRPGKSSHTIRGMLAETLKTGGIVGPNGRIGPAIVDGGADDGRGILGI